MARASKTSGGSRINDKNREAARAQARDYAAKGKSAAGMRAKDMPYGWALPKESSKPKPPSNRPGGEKGYKESARGNAGTPGNKPSGSASKKPATRKRPGEEKGYSESARSNAGRPGNKPSGSASRKPGKSTKTNPTGTVQKSKGLTATEAKALRAAAQGNAELTTRFRSLANKYKAVNQKVSDAGDKVDAAVFGAAKSAGRKIAKAVTSRGKATNAKGSSKLNPTGAMKPSKKRK